MMYTSLDIRFEGHEFYPSRLRDITKLPIKTLAEFGQVSSRGKYKGKPSPYGIAVLEMPETDKQINVPDLIQLYSTRLLENRDHLKDCGVEEIIFDIESAAGTPAELSLSPAILGNLSALNARIAATQT